MSIWLEPKRQFLAWRIWQEHAGPTDASPQTFGQLRVRQHLDPQVALMAYGWWNCISHTIRRVEIPPALHRQYEALFSELQTECEDEC